MPYAAQCRIAVVRGRSPLGRLGAALRSAGAELISIDFHRGEGDRLTDQVDLVLELPDDVDRSRLARLLADTGGGRLVSHLPPPAETDPVLGILNRCRDLLDAGTADELDSRASAAIASVCGTRTALVGDLRRALIHEAAVSAVERGTPVMQRTSAVPVEIGGHAIKDGWLLAVPDARTGPTRLALVARGVTEPFSSTEIARVQSIMAIRRASPAAHPADGPESLRMVRGAR